MARSRRWPGSRRCTRAIACAEPDRAPALPQTRICPGCRSFRARSGHRSRDLQAHYNLMLCYRGLGDNLKRKREEVLFRRFKADESSQTITAKLRALSPKTTTNASRSTNTKASNCHEELILAGLACAAACRRGDSPTDQIRRHPVRSQRRQGGQEVLPETMGAGVAFVDLNGDGLPDIVLVNGKDWTPKGGVPCGRVPEQRRWHVHQRDCRQRPGRRNVRHRHRRRRLR